MTRPKLDLQAALNYLSAFDLNPHHRVKLLGVRGYYKNSMGIPGFNDMGIYDDMIAILDPFFFEAFNANTDPSKLNPKVAVLKAGGPYIYKVGRHKTYEALRQHGDVTVLRGVDEHTDSPEQRFYINIHKGGYNTTSSLGCQTIYPDQWSDFMYKIKRELLLYKQPVIPYYLIEV